MSPSTPITEEVKGAPAPSLPSSATPSVLNDDSKNDLYDRASIGSATERTVIVDGITVHIDPKAPPLADSATVKRWGWLDVFRPKQNQIQDWDAIATRPSFFDDPNLAPHYMPKAEWENIHRVDTNARWTYAEEKALVRKLDWRILLWIIVMFLALDLDRGNLSQANSANFLKDLKLTTDDFNMGNSLSKAGFLIAELPSQLISKKVGPDRWIPVQMCLWSIVAGAQFWLKGRSSFLATRFLLGLLQGGFIPDVILYLSYFYTKAEMTPRLAWFYTCNYTINIFAGFLAIGLLQLDGVHGYSGWRWLFLIEALFTLVVGLVTFFNMPAAPTKTKTWFRPKGWFTDQEEIIMTNRILRDDPAKGMMHNRQGLTWTMLWESLTDFDLWPLYLIGLTFQLPQNPVQTYLTLAYRQLGFTTVQTNLLSLPNIAIALVTLITAGIVSDIFDSRALVATTQNIWILPCLIALYLLPGNQPWNYFAVTTVLLGSPYVHAIVVSWVSMNAGSVRTRTVGSSLYNMSVQLSSVIGSYIYRKDDAPRYRRGNRALIGIACMNIIAFPLIRYYYIKRNEYKRRKWEALSPREQADYLETTTDTGSKRLDFQLFY